MKAVKIGGMVLGGIVVVLVVGVLGAKGYSDATYFSGYDASAPLDPAITDIQQKPAYVRTTFYFNGWRGGRVPALLMTPHEVTGPLPCVIFLHGIGQDKDFVDEDFGGKTVAQPFVEAGFAFVSFDQYMRGERRLKNVTPFQEGQAFRLRPAYTVNDTRRLIDYLQTRADIAPNRIYLAGASYGAITGSIVAAMDKRIPAAVLTYGGANLRYMLHAAEVEKAIGKYMIPAQIVGWLFLGVADPIHYVGRISPRPVFLQNGTADVLIATAAARAFQDAAKEPKKIKWYQGNHIGSDPATVIIVLKDIIDFFKEEDAKIVASGSAAKAGA